jgi:hypothetical protein
MNFQQRKEYQSSAVFWFPVRSQAKDSKKAKVEQSEFNEELSKCKSKLPL